MVKEGDYVAIFHSIHRVMKAEKILLAQQLDILLIPVPRQLSADCGMAIRFAQESFDQVVGALRKANMESAEIWLKRSGQFQRLP